MKEKLSFFLLISVTYCQSFKQEKFSNNVLEEINNMTGSADVPQFFWLDPTSIQVIYPDHANDILHLRTADRVADIVVRCLFSGNFEKETLGSFMVSGCMNDSYVYLTIYSSHLPSSTSFIWEHSGVTKLVANPYTNVLNETVPNEEAHFEDEVAEEIAGKRTKRGTFSYADADNEDYSDYSDYSEDSEYSEYSDYVEYSNSSEYYEYNADEEEYYDLAFDGGVESMPSIPPDLILQMKLAYDEKMLQQMNGNHSAAQAYIAEVVSHSSLHLSHSSLGTRIHLLFMEPPRFLSGKRLGINKRSMKIVQKEKKNEAIPLIAFTKTDDSNKNMGVAFPGSKGGVCHESMGTGVLKWRSNPLLAAISFSHENGHMTGLRHDFKEDKKQMANGTCEGNGIMSRGDTNIQRPAKWSQCSSIRIRKWYNRHGHCLAPASVCDSSDTWNTPCTCGSGDNSVACLSSHRYCLEKHFGDTPYQCLGTDDLKALAMPQRGAVNPSDESISSRLMVVVGMMLKNTELLYDEKKSRIDQQRQITSQETLLANMLTQLHMERNGTQVSSKNSNVILLNNRQPSSSNDQKKITNLEVLLSNQEKLVKNQEKLIANLINKLDMEKNGTVVSLKKSNLNRGSNQQIRQINEQNQITNQELRFANQEKLLQNQDTRIANQERIIQNQELRLANQEKIIQNHEKLISNLITSRDMERDSAEISSSNIHTEILHKITNQEIRLENHAKWMKNQDEQLKNHEKLTTELEMKINGNNAINLKNLENPAIEDRINMLEKLNVLRTCNELEESGVSVSGYYNLDPDGDKIGHPPIKVYCNFQDKVTEILHDEDDNLNIIQYCESPSCYTQNYKYTVHMDQITALMDLSSFCEQTIEYHCNGAPLSYEDIQFGVWMDRHGEDQVYFDGSNHGKHMCSCDSSNNCTGNQFLHNTCNCDNTAVRDWMQDGGKLTNMSALPVISFKYGPFMSQTQEAKVKVGRLRCGGKKEVVGNIPRSCKDLKLLGETRPGLYQFLDGNNGDHPKMSYCQLNQAGYGGGMESNSHWLKFSSGPGQVFFAVERTGDITLHSTITFNRIIVNQGSGMKESGVFTAPASGFYDFKFSGMADDGDGRCTINIYLNGIKKVVMQEENPGTWYSSFSRAWIFELQHGDTVTMSLVQGRIEGTDNHFQFIGVLL